ncbi:MAG: nucleotidyltransferase family protein [Eubacteriaceae bacterium]|nr:nucleotidyltransferase family protein [Eubacteriaceae bacterium]
MSSTAFIPCEYNPFHRGHAAQMEILRSELGFERIVSLMSGPFVQRGGPAALPVEERAKAAVDAGCDLVLMMPFAYCAQTAETFARGTVFTAAACGARYLCFGTEDPDRREELLTAARLLADENILMEISSLAKGNVPYPAARIRVLEEKIGKNMGFLEKPNNILALEYMRSIAVCAPGIEAVPLRRVAGLPPASEIRSRMEKDDPAGIRTLREYAPVLKYLITMGEPGPIESICGYYKGLLPRMKDNLPLLGEDTDEFISRVNTATVPSSRIRRFLVNLMMGYTEEDRRRFFSSAPGYIRVLAIGKKGGEILKEISLRGDIYTVTKPSAAVKEGILGETDRMLFDMDNRAVDLYNLTSGRTGEAMRYTPAVKK